MRKVLKKAVAAKLKRAGKKQSESNAGREAGTITATLHDLFDVPNEVNLVRFKPASDKAVKAVLRSPVGMDGRSEWKWFRLANGDLILGVFPTGDMYFMWEDEHAF